MGCWPGLEELTMYQVTALYGDAEIGYGEGETYEDAARECADSCADVVPVVYPAADVVLACTHGAIETETPLDLWLACA